MTIIAVCIQPLPYVLCFAIVLIPAYIIIILNFYPFREAPGIVLVYFHIMEITIQCYLKIYNRSYNMYPCIQTPPVPSITL